MEKSLRAALLDFDGGLYWQWPEGIVVPGLERPGPPPGDREFSGREKDGYPRDVVADPPSLLQMVIRLVVDNACGWSEVPSEFLRPWLYPEEDNAHGVVATELPPTPPGPFRPLEDATVLMGNSPGHPDARRALELAQNEGQTQALVHNLFAEGKHLGDPVDYSAYVIARLTRDHPEPIANFNLDADRGYGYLCWDWLRSDTFRATPDVVGWKSTDGVHRVNPRPQDPQDQCAYNAPLRPGFGWCARDLAVENPPRPPTQTRPTSLSCTTRRCRPTT